MTTAVPDATPTVEAHAGSMEELLGRVRSSYDTQFPSEEGDTTYRFVVATYPDDSYIVVCHTDGVTETYYRHDYEVEADSEQMSVKFAPATPMVLTVVPEEALRESDTHRRLHLREDTILPVAESLATTRGTDGNTLTMTVLAQGFNTSRTRYYTESALRSGVQAFADSKMFVNHPTIREEEERPEGSLHDWAATITNLSYDSTGKRLRATARLVDPNFKSKIDMLESQGLLQTLGISIRAVGAGEESVIEGDTTFRVDSFIAGKSVDFVTYPGAGGFVEARESKEPAILKSEEDEVMSAEAIAAAERRAAEAEQRSKEMEAKLSEMTELRAKAEESAAAATSAIEALKAEATHREAQQTIHDLIEAATVPEPSKAYLRDSLTSETDVERAKASIERHKALVTELAGVGTVREMGESAPSGGAPVDVASSVRSLFGNVSPNREAAS